MGIKRLGIRAHDLRARDLDELVEELSSYDLSFMQLALKKTFVDWNHKKEVVKEEYLPKVAKSFKTNNFTIAILGSYINMASKDEDVRKLELQNFINNLEYAKHLGALYVGTETGTVNPKGGYTVENYCDASYDIVIDSMKFLVNRAEQLDVMIALEGGINHPIHTPELLRQLADELKSSHLFFILDIANYINIENIGDAEKVIDRSIEALGNNIKVVHIKDYVEKDGQIEFVPLGTGELPLEYLLSQLNKLENSKEIIFLLEATQTPYIADAINFFEKTSNKIHNKTI